MASKPTETIILRVRPKVKRYALQVAKAEHLNLTQYLTAILMADINSRPRWGGKL